MRDLEQGARARGGHGHLSRRQVVRGAAALGLATPLLGGRRATPTVAAQDQPITLRFAGWIGMEESTAKQFQHMVELFTARHPNVTIEYEGIAWENTRQQLLLEASAGNPPDVAQVTAPWIGQFAYSGAIEPLETLAADLIPDYVDGVIDSYTFPVADGTAHTWRLPWVGVHAAAFYNTALLEKAGVDPTKLPQTIDEFDTMVRAVAVLGQDEQGNAIWGFTTATDRSELTANIFNQWLFNFGGDVLDDDSAVSIDNEAGVATLGDLKQLVDDKVMPAGFAFRDTYNLMVNYQTGGFTDGSYARDVLRITSGKGEAFQGLRGRLRANLPLRPGEPRPAQDDLPPPHARPLRAEPAQGDGVRVHEVPEHRPGVDALLRAGEQPLSALPAGAAGSVLLAGRLREDFR